MKTQENEEEGHNLSSSSALEKEQEGVHALNDEEGSDGEMPAQSQMSACDVRGKGSAFDSALDTAETSRKRFPINCGLLRRLPRKFPRLYHLVVSVFLPLFTLIGISFLFGYALALMESPQEMARNNEKLRVLFNEYFQYASHQQDVRDASQQALRQCLRGYDSDVTQYGELNKTYPDLFPSVDQCYDMEADKIYNTLNITDYLASLEFLLDFDWTLCPRETRGFNRSTGWDRELETAYYVKAYHESFQRLRREAVKDGLNDTSAIGPALRDARGGEKCSTHISAGALFWFTIMTTIGYGNTAPVTGGGRALVFTFGFASVITFTALTGKAGYVVVTIIDDGLQQSRWLRPLSRGLPAVLFWLVVLIIWVRLLASIAIIYAGERRETVTSDAFEMKDALWFSYITLTTVGLGDIHIGHEEFRWGDMFYLPLILLLGFVCLANFALKLGAYILEIWPEDETLDDILKEQRQER